MSDIAICNRNRKCYTLLCCKAIPRSFRNSMPRSLSLKRYVINSLFASPSSQSELRPMIWERTTSPLSADGTSRSPIYMLSHFPTKTTQCNTTQPKTIEPATAAKIFTLTVEHFRLGRRRENSTRGLYYTIKDL